MIQTMLDLGGDTTPHPFIMACGEQPQARMEQFGRASLSDTELLALVIQGHGTRPENAIALAARLIAEAGSLPALATWLPRDYERITGIGRCKGMRLSAIAEIARRMLRSDVPTPILQRPDQILAHFLPLVIGLEVEKFWVLCLNRKNRLLKQVEITSGTATSALAHPREVYRAAIRESATAIVCVHNHPSGDPAPSPQDLHVTRQLREASKAIAIDFIDHVIVGRPETDPLGRGYFSMREAGIL